MTPGLAAAILALAALFPAPARAQADEQALESPGEPTPTFARDVAPLVHARCAGCHHPGGSGPFDLLTFRDVRKRARQIRRVTATRIMPPWQAVPGYGEFLEPRRLEDDELALLLAWIDGGAPEGNPAEAPEPPSFSTDWKLGEPDRVVRMPEAFEVPAEGKELWRTFVLSPDLEEDRWLSAVEFRPGNERVVHHFIMYVDSEGTARAMDAADPGVGYAGMKAEVGLLGRELYGWLPGMSPQRLPARTATHLPRGADLVLDTHFVMTGKVEPVQMEVGLHYAEGPPEVLPTGVIMIGPGATIPPGVRDYTIGETFELPVDVRLFSVAPHAHYVCKEIDLWAERPDGARVELLRIEDWDPNWQDVYRYAEEVPLPAGSRLHMTFSYDNGPENGRNPFSPPRRIVTGARSFNEMAVAWFSAMVDDPDDLETLERAMTTKYRADSKRATDLTAIWHGLVRTFDKDDDESLDAEEEARATAYVDGIFENVPHLLAAFDADRNGELDETERRRAEQIVRYWNGEPVK